MIKSSRAYRALEMFGCAVFCASILCGCQGTQEGEGGQGNNAYAVLSPTAGNHVSGKVTFTKEARGVRVIADIEGLTPGLHGFHIHEKGDCSSPDAVSAGGHFNPSNNPHSGPDHTPRHVGDLGNIQADENGYAHYERVDSIITLEGPHSIIGRSVIVHEARDNYVTQPTGDAGARVACGVVISGEEP